MIYNLSKVLDWNTDKFVGVGMVLTMIISLFLGVDSNILTNIISGLFGYMSKTMIEEKNDKGGKLI